MSQTVSAPTPDAPAPSRAPADAEKFVPDAVRQAAARADEAMRAIAAARADGAPAAPTPSPTPSPAPVGGQGPVEAPPAPTAGPGGTAQGAAPAAPIAPAAPSGNPSNAELEELRARLDRAEQNERTWRGRYEAEVPRKDAVATLEAELAQARRELQEAQDRRAAATLAEADSVPALTDAERESFGTDMVDIISRQAHHTMKPLLDAMRTNIMAEITRLREALAPTQQIAAESAKDRFFNAIEAALPGALALDSDPAFLAWLGEKDPLSRRTRQIMLDEAASVHDVDACVEFFRAFLAQTGRPAPQSSGESPAVATSPKAQNPQGSKPSAPAAKRPAPSLSDFAAPGTARTTGTPALTEGQVMIWTRSEIAEFYQDKARGKYRVTPAEAERIEAEIFAAMKDGRIDEAR